MHVEFMLSSSLESVQNDEVSREGLAPAGVIEAHEAENASSRFQYSFLCLQQPAIHSMTLQTPVSALLISHPSVALSSCVVTSKKTHGSDVR